MQRFQQTKRTPKPNQAKKDYIKLWMFSKSNLLGSFYRSAPPRTTQIIPQPIVPSVTYLFVAMDSCIRIYKPVLKQSYSCFLCSHHNGMVCMYHLVYRRTNVRSYRCMGHFLLVVRMALFANEKYIENISLIHTINMYSVALHLHSDVSITHCD